MLKRILRRFFPGTCSFLSAKYHKIKRAVKAYAARKKEKLFRIKKDIASFQNKPEISIIITSSENGNARLKSTIRSVRKQFYKNCRIYLIDKKNISEKPSDKIALSVITENSVTEKVLSPYICLIEAGTALRDTALYEIVKTINSAGPDLIYSDEDEYSGIRPRRNIFYKPDYSPDLLLSLDYMSRVLVLKNSFIRPLLEESLKETSGVNAYDLVLRAVEKTDKIAHISEILCRTSVIRKTDEEKNVFLEKKKYFIESALKRRNIPGKVTIEKETGGFRVSRDLFSAPLVSIVIPFKDQSEVLKVCLDSIIRKTTYRNFEIIGVSKNSSEEITFNTMREYENADKWIKFFEYNIPFNFSKVCNFGAGKAKGEHLLFLNNDTEVITEDWIEELLQHSQRTETGIIGAKLYYPDRSIQHAGIIIDRTHVAVHFDKMPEKENAGYEKRLSAIQNFSALTAACFMLKRALFEKLHGFNEKELSVTFNDIDLCLRAAECGLLNVYNPFCELFHHECLSRGQDITGEKRKRVQEEKDYVNERHKEYIRKGDPYYNRNMP